ncbi:MAG TPA: MlaD family protein [Thermoleophilaceae bacterium]|nr:MlaD family protein [Thermoleophilaceae bacterium]
MQKNAPSLGRILSMVVFALSCFGLLLFLWLSFGGAIPLKPKRYELRVNFPEATTLAEQADVRIAGVNVGKVQRKELNKGANATKVTLQIESQYAPIAKDAKAILRQKTLLGETYVELSPGHKKRGTLKDGALLANRQVEPTVELDEILRIFDPDTKDAFRQWVAESAQQIKNGGGQDLNYAIGNLSQFASDGAGVLEVLDNQNVALKSVIKNTGVVFAALNARYGQLRDLIVNSQRTFSATAAQKEALARTFAIFPTFLDESRLTLRRLTRFSLNTRPLVRDLKPVADDLAPTVRDVARLAPDLESLFRRLKPVIAAAPDDLPDAARFLRGAQPLFEALHVFLPELNPIISYANYDSLALGGFLGDGAAGLYFNPNRGGGGPDKSGVPQYMLGQAGVNNGNSIGIHQQIPAYDRGTAYQLANALKRGKVLGVVSESFSCAQDTRPEAEKSQPQEGSSSDGSSGDLPPCFVQPAHLWGSVHEQYPNVNKGEAPLVNSPTGATPPPLPPFH